MGLFSSEFITLIGEATSEYLPGAQEDLEKNLEICDLIKSRQVNGRVAMRAIKERLLHRNPNVQLLALALIDAAIKNTGPHFLRELASREFVDVLVQLCKVEGGYNPATISQMVRERAQELLQTWATLLGRQDGLQYMVEAYEQAKREGVEFPALSTHAAVPPSFVATSAPPEWTDSPHCVRCNVTFGLLLRKHHCRRCGRTFCQDCSSKQMSLPEMGLYDEVRVCEGCFAEHFVEKTSLRGSRNNSSSSTPNDGGQAQRGRGGDSFDDDLAKAITLSLKETSPYPSTGRMDKELPPIPEKSTKEEYDEEAAFATAIAASLREAQIDDYCPSSGSASIPLSSERVEAAETALLITPIERENVQLFAELVDRLNPHDEELENPEFLQLAHSLMALRARLRNSIETGDATADIPRILATLESALQRFEHLGLSPDPSGPLDTPDLSATPSRPRSQTGSIMYAQVAKDDNRTHPVPPALPPPFSQPPPADVVPVLLPKPARLAKAHRKSKEEQLIPNLDVEGDPDHSESTKEDPLAELLSDAPLIQF